MPLQFELCPGRMIGGSHPCFIIAEIGQNHQGDIEIAKKMIKMAKVNSGSGSLTMNDDEKIFGL